MGNDIVSIVRELQKRIDKLASFAVDVATGYDHEHHSKGEVPKGQCDGFPRCRACSAIEALGYDPDDA